MMPVMSTKEVLLEVAEKLPPDATLVDAIHELEFRQAVKDGLASLDRGERIPLEEARKRIPQWTTSGGFAANLTSCDGAPVPPEDPRRLSIC